MSLLTRKCFACKEQREFSVTAESLGQTPKGHYSVKVACSHCPEKRVLYTMVSREFAESLKQTDNNNNNVRHTQSDNNPQAGVDSN